MLRMQKLGCLSMLLILLQSAVIKPEPMFNAWGFTKEQESFLALLHQPIVVLQPLPAGYFVETVSAGFRKYGTEAHLGPGDGLFANILYSSFDHPSIELECVASGIGDFQPSDQSYKNKDYQSELIKTPTLGAFQMSRDGRQVHIGWIQARKGLYCSFNSKAISYQQMKQLVPNIKVKG